MNNKHIKLTTLMLGIGLAASAQWLSPGGNPSFTGDPQVNGNFRITNNNKGYMLQSTTSARYGLKYGNAGNVGSSDNLALTNREGGGSLLLQTCGTGGGAANEATRIAITPGGNVGVPTTTPAALLHVGTMTGFGDLNGTTGTTVRQNPPFLVVGNLGGTGGNTNTTAAEFRSQQDNSSSVGIRIRGSRVSLGNLDAAHIDLANFARDKNTGVRDFDMARIAADMQSTGTNESGYMKFYTNNGTGLNQTVLIDATGNVGIGSNASYSGVMLPTRRLDVDGNGRFRDLPGATTTNPTEYVVVDADGNLFTTSAGGSGGADADWFLTPSTTNTATGIGQDIYTLGTVGIGTGTPSTNNSLDVLQNAGVTGASGIRVINTESVSNQGNILNGIEGRVGSTANAGGLYYGVRFTAESVKDNYGGHFTGRGSSAFGNSWGVYALADAGDVNFGVQGLAQNGNLLNTGGLFEATGGTAATNIGGQFCASGGANNYAIIVPANCGNVGIGTPTPDTSYILDIVGDVNINGTGYITGGSWSSSDRRFKQNIRDVKNANELIQRLSGVTYNYRSDIEGYNFMEGRSYGFIAQDLQKVIPELVTTKEDGYLAVNYQGVIPVLVEAMKEQQAEIEALKASVGADQNSGEAPGSPASNGSGHQLFQNTPNPTSGAAEIKTLIMGESQGTVYIFDSFGNRMFEAEVGSGTQVTRIEDGLLMTGSYFYSLLVDGEFIDSKKMVVVK